MQVSDSTYSLYVRVQSIITMQLIYIELKFMNAKQYKIALQKPKKL